MKKPLAARSEYAKWAAKSYRNAANLIEAGKFEQATENLKLGTECLTHLLTEMAALLKTPKAR